MWPENDRKNDDYSGDTILSEVGNHFDVKVDGELRKRRIVLKPWWDFH